MPFKRGTSDATTEANFHEFRHGNRYAKVRRKHGKKKAHQMMIAAVLENRRRSKLKKDTMSGEVPPYPTSIAAIRKERNLRKSQPEVYELVDLTAEGIL